VGSRVGLFTAIARPERLVSALARARLVPEIIVRAPDHGPLTSRLENEIRTSNVDIWLATAKCAVHFEGVDRAPPLAILDGSLVLSPSIVRALDLGGVGDAPTWVA
jgi:tetraacyldisaccharide-1-P 4'-kinase